MTNKFVSFLETAGKVIADAASVYAGIGPLFTQLLPAKEQPAVTAAGNDLEAIASEIVNVEGVFAAVTSAPTGPLKLQAAIPRVAAIVQSALAMTPDVIEDTALYNQGIAEITQGVVDVLNSRKPTVQTQAPATASAAPSVTLPAVLETPPSAS